MLASTLTQDNDVIVVLLDFQLLAFNQYGHPIQVTQDSALETLLKNEAFSICSFKPSSRNRELLMLIQEDR